MGAVKLSFLVIFGGLNETAFQVGRYGELDGTAFEVACVAGHRVQSEM